MYSFSYLEPVCCSMSSSNCCFLTCIQVSQEAGKVVRYSHLLNFPQFVVIHTVKGFGTVSKAEIDVFLELSWFFHDPVDVCNLISGSSAFPVTKGGLDGNFLLRPVVCFLLELSDYFHDFGVISKVFLFPQLSLVRFASAHLTHGLPWWL